MSDHTLPQEQRCSHVGCHENGLYKAPRKTGGYLWFCLKHIREYNAKWDDLAGCSAQDIEARIRNATVWERPTWPFGHGPFSFRPKQHKAEHDDKKPIPEAATNALSFMGLEPPSTLHAVKKRYRTLAKRYHPDLNDGKLEFTNEFHKLQNAFAVLQDHYTRKRTSSP